MCKKMFSLLFIIIIGFHSCRTLAQQHLITDYQPIFIPLYNKQEQLKIAIRKYYLANQLYYLTVDPYIFSTESAPAVAYKPRKIVANAPGYFKMSELQQTPYLKALMKYSAAPYKLENYGITRAEINEQGNFLTIDMCPSVKPFETAFYHSLVALSAKKNKPIPIAISITGLWIIGHPQEFNWLVKQQRAKKLAITWINHSFSHLYFPDLAFKDNFLLMQQTNINEEILATEKILLEHKQLPSVFFRFPGLVSNEKLILKLRSYGLIAVGSDAWLAHDQAIKNGSIILVHGNSNEPEGIQKIQPLVNDSQLHFLPLSAAFY